MTATLAEDAKNVIGISNGHRAIFDFKNDGENIKSFGQAFRELQEAMSGAAEEMGLKNEDDVVALIKETRAEIYDSFS